MPKYSCSINLKLYLITDNKKIAQKHLNSILSDVMNSCPYASRGTITNVEREYKSRERLQDAKD